MRALLCCLFAFAAAAEPDWIGAAQAVLPVARTRPGDAVEVTAVEAVISAVDQVATTTLTIRLRNRSRQRAEAVLLLPLPPLAQVRGFACSGPGGALTVNLMPADQARATYQAIVRAQRDPALLEFAGDQLLRSSVFPVEPLANAEVRLSWEQLLERRHGRLELALPRSATLAYAVPWTLTATLSHAAGIGSVYSPTHRLTERQRSRDAVSLLLTGAMAPGAFQLAWLPMNDAAVTIFCHVDNDDGWVKADSRPTGDTGTFLVLADPPAAQPGKAIPREVTVVLDRSGSMNGEKWTQATDAVGQVLGGLAANESFNLILFNEGVDTFSPTPVACTAENESAVRHWLRSARPSGGTNIHDALVAALGQPATPGKLPLVLFCTDGLPTIGTTGEGDIRRKSRQIQGNRRIFPIGIGADVNVPLLDRLADDSRGRSRHLPPGGDVEVAVADLFRSLGAPVLADPVLVAAGPGRLMDLQPRRLRDVFAGEQLVILGRWIGREPIALTLSGTGPDGQTVQRTVQLDPALASPRHAFVPRLWASRRIAELVASIRDLGAGSPADPKQLAELTGEVVRLSQQYGIMTDYTAFLATDGPSALPGHRGILGGFAGEDGAPAGKAAGEFQKKAIGTRSGKAAQIYSDNNKQQAEATVLNPLNGRTAEDGVTQVRENAVQQCADKTLYRQGKDWIEAAAVGRPIARTIAFASPEHFALVERLARKNRQVLAAQDGPVVIVDGEEVVCIAAP